MSSVSRCQWKLGLELGAVVGLHDVHAERQPPQDVVDEADRRALVAGVVDLEHANARAVVDGRELIEALSGARDPLEELHVHLQAVARLRLLVSLPALPVRPVLLIGRQPVHAVP